MSYNRSHGKQWYLRIKGKRREAYATFEKRFCFKFLLCEVES